MTPPPRAGAGVGFAHAMHQRKELRKSRKGWPRITKQMQVMAHAVFNPKRAADCILTNPKGVAPTKAQAPPLAPPRGAPGAEGIGQIPTPITTLRTSAPLPSE